MITKTFVLALVSLLSITVFAEQGARPPLTPEQAAEQKRRAADTAIAEGVRPIEMLDSVWIEELSWMEVRDLIAAGKTTVLLGSGGVEKNGPYTATGKHNYMLKTTLEAIARKHSQAAGRAARHVGAVQSRSGESHARLVLCHARNLQGAAP